MNEYDIDRETLAAIFASRVALAKRTEEEAMADAAAEHRRTLAWVASTSRDEKSFVWMCDEFDVDPGAVRRAILEKRK